MHDNSKQHTKLRTHTHMYAYALFVRVRMYLETLGLRLDLHGVALSYLALFARRVLALIGQLRVVLLAHLAVAQALNLLQVLVLQVLR